MKLKSLRLHGFKSFPDATRVEFHDGITAIVGPNGCGKSNIGDAIRWVLGEQRPTVVRGAKMEEVIFQGTASRRPVNRGSVSMIVTNEDGALAIPYGEVEIGRAVYRDGGSDYRLNRATCRLRDIVDLCRDTGLGANAYSVIEIRMIDAILSGRADERRSLFEEAAGIGKYKERRRAAIRRLETSEADLQRVEDVIGEVRTKVRSLARQKGKAQRYRDLRERRLAVEVAVVREELEQLRGRLARVERELQSDREESVGMAAALATAEAELERARLERVEAERARTACARQLDAVGGELARIETEVAVAGERLANGQRRLEQIAGERETQTSVQAHSEDEVVVLADSRDECKVSFTLLQANLTERRQAATEVRERLDIARGEARELEDRSRGLARTMARLEGDRDSARLQVRELQRRIEQLSLDARRGAGALREVESQRDLFADRRTSTAQSAEEATREFEAGRRRLDLIRERLREARTGEMQAEARLSALEAESKGLRRVAEREEGTGSVAMAARETFPGAVRGAVPDFVRVSGPVARGVDEVLGRFASALVVGGKDDVEEIARWYHGADDRVAALLLLPLDAVPEAGGALPTGVTALGEGAPWVRALLGGAAASARGWRDCRGAVHLFPEAGAEGRLERRGRIETLDAESELARGSLDEARAKRLHLEEEHGVCEREADAASERVLAARDEARAAESEAATQSDRRARLARHQEEVSRRLEGARASREGALQRARTAEAQRDRLREEEGTLAGRIEDRRSVLAAVEAEWEQAREAESEATIRAARLESRLERLEGQLRDAGTAVERAAARLGDLAVEESALTVEMQQVRAGRDERGDALEVLFGKRDELRGSLSEHDRMLAGATGAVADAERRLGDLRATERQAVGHRHQLELREQDIRNRASRITERLEAEWGRPAEALFDEAEPLEGDPERLRDELEDIVRSLSRIGPVNMLAVEEHAEESTRLDFLVRQQEDLVAARNDLRSAIRRINATATELFMNSFEAINENFRSTFHHLFSGGQAKLWLADPENPLESPIEIHAAPKGKRTQRIDLLSGGERALTALALLFGIYLVKPSPFCVLDEVDAPFDDSNIGRFIRLLQGFKAQTQFVVITHNPRTIEAADWIYGVTMEEPGVSSIVGVRLESPAEVEAVT